MLTSAGNSSGFVAKFDASGQHSWSKSFGDDSVSETHVGVDANGNVLLAGQFRGTIDLGGEPLTSAAGAAGLFTAKLDPSGNHVWSKQFGDADDVHRHVWGLATDNSANVLLTGAFEGALDFGGGILNSAGQWDAFVVKLDAAGEHQWSRQISDADTISGTAVVADLSGCPLVGGTFRTGAELGGQSLVSVGQRDLYVAKLPP